MICPKEILKGACRELFMHFIFKLYLFIKTLVMPNRFCIITFLIFLLAYSTTVGQPPAASPIIWQAYTNINRSFAGSGDLYGLFVNIGLHKYNKTGKGFLAFETGFSIHDGEVYLRYTDNFRNPPVEVDGSYRYTTGGIQIAALAGRELLKSTSRHHFTVALGPLLRYQSSSYFDNLQILFPALTNYPNPLWEIRNTTPHRSFAIGGKGSIQYGYAVAKNWTLALHSSLQTDTNGDTFSNYGLGGGFWVK